MFKKIIFNFFLFKTEAALPQSNKDSGDNIEYEFSYVKKIENDTIYLSLFSTIRNVSKDLVFYPFYLENFSLKGDQIFYVTDTNTADICCAHIIGLDIQARGKILNSRFDSLIPIEKNKIIKVQRDYKCRIDGITKSFKFQIHENVYIRDIQSEMQDNVIFLESPQYEVFLPRKNFIRRIKFNAKMKRKKL
jgi:hypothetical protein